MNFYYLVRAKRFLKVKSTNLPWFSLSCIFSSLIKTSQFYSPKIIYFSRKLTPAIHFSQVLQSTELATVGNRNRLKTLKQMPMPRSFVRKGKRRKKHGSLSLRQVIACSNSINVSGIKMLMRLPLPRSTAAFSNSRISPSYIFQSHQE